MTVHTIIGATGLIGSRLSQYLSDRGEHVSRLNKVDKIDYSVNHGHVYYCAGVTADFRTRRAETIQAHVCFLQEFLSKANFESFLYLSSTRVYHGALEALESSDLNVNPSRMDDLYNISKLMGESICLNAEAPFVRVVRLSNVITPYEPSLQYNFFDQLLSAILSEGRVNLRSDLRSEKDYVDVDDVIPLLVKINVLGRERLYNLARGINMTHQDLIATIRQRVALEFVVNVLPNAPVLIFPRIDNQKIIKEFGFLARSLDETISDRVKAQIKGNKDAL